MCTHGDKQGGGKEAGSGIYEGGKDGSGICVNI